MFKDFVRCQVCFNGIKNKDDGLVCSTCCKTVCISCYNDLKAKDPNYNRCTQIGCNEFKPREITILEIMGISLLQYRSEIDGTIRNHEKHIMHLEEIAAKQPKTGELNENCPISEDINVYSHEFIENFVNL